MDHQGRVVEWNPAAEGTFGYTRAEDRVKAVMSGFQHQVSKPVDPAELIAMIASLSNWSD